MELLQEHVSSQVLDHLGLVASTIKKLDLVRLIDERLPVNENKGAKLSMGTRVAAMTLNGLGFVKRKLYMFPDFLKNKPVEKLLGDGLSAEDFNDDTLGRCLDAIYDYGVMKLFSEISFHIGSNLNLLGKSIHLDTTTLSLSGDFDNESIPKLENEQVPAHPAFGYPKNGRFDLKQMVLLLATTGKAGFPIWMQAHNGNASDKATLHEAAQNMKIFYDELKQAPDMLFVADSAAYEACLNNSQTFFWLSRVPETHNLAKELISCKDEDMPWENLDKGYKIHTKKLTYNQVEQRWVLVYSQQAYDREIKTLEKSILTEYSAASKSFGRLQGQLFGCAKDAELALKNFQRSLKYHMVEDVVFQEVLGYKGRGRPKAGAEKTSCGVQIFGKLSPDQNSIEKRRLHKGRFILATNQLDEQALTDKDILLEYKEQSKTESGFRFIKDNDFQVSNVFLKKPERINALMMIMTLCLMIYNVAQYLLRESLEKSSETLPNQLKKQIKNPTMAWVCEMFSGIGVVLITIDGRVQEFVTNLNDVLRRVIRHFGPQACRIYGV